MLTQSTIDACTDQIDIQRLRMMVGQLESLLLTKQEIIENIRDLRKDMHSLIPRGSWYVEGVKRDGKFYFHYEKSVKGRLGLRNAN